MDTTKAITHVSLCAGYGGIDIGLSRAIPSLRTVAFSEIEAFACANLVSKMEAGLLDCAPIWTDLKTFPWAAFHGRVDILSGGYPCQPFSAAGKRLGTEDPRHLWPYIADGIRSMRPRLCFFENVEGHISLGLREVVSELEGIGYKVAWGIFSAREVGAPHQRKRVFIMAFDKSIGLSQIADIRTGWKSIRSITDCGELAYCDESRLEGILQQAIPFKEKQDEFITRRSRTLADTNGSGSRQDWEPIELRSTRTEQSPSNPWGSAEGEVRQGNAWPSRPGQPQYGWEPPRVVGNATHGSNGQHTSEQQGRDTSGRSSAEGASMGDTKHNGSHQCSEETRGQITSSRRQTQPPLGGNPHGTTCGMDYAELQDADSAMRGDNIGTVDGAMADTEHEREDGTTGEMEAEECPNEGRKPKPWDSPQTTWDKSSGGGYAELCVTCDNRTDELRLLGNGVVPATAERAFRTLLAELIP